MFPNSFRSTGAHRQRTSSPVLASRQAAFALERNAVSDLVRTDFGFHIIQVTDIRRPQPQPFEAVRDRLTQELRTQQAQRQFAEAAETFTIETTLDAAALERAKAALSNGTALRYRLHGTITVEPNGRAYPIDYSSALSRAPGLDGVLR